MHLSFELDFFNESVELVNKFDFNDLFINLPQEPFHKRKDQDF